MYMKKENITKRTQFILGVYILFFITGLSLLQSVTTPYTVIQEGTYLFQAHDIKGFLKSAIYFLVYLTSLIAITMGIFTRNTLIATMMIGFIIISYIIDLTVQFIGNNDNGLSIEIFTLAMIEKARAADLYLFRTQIFKSIAVSTIIITFVILARTVFFKKFRVNTFVSIFTFFLSSGLALGAVFNVFSIVGQSFPAPIKTISIASEYYLGESDQKPRILNSTISPEKNPEYKTIIWIIDESIGGQYLSANGYHVDTTPYLKVAQNNQDMLNYGIVPSISNCSGDSNLLLRIGLTTHLKESFKESLKNLPTIFQYAQRANFETYLIDAQAAEGQLQNRMTVEDKLHVDDFITFKRFIAPNKRDQEVMKHLNTILNTKDNKNRFIVVVKWGAHWPYSLTYPEDRQFFKPVASGSWTEMNEENKQLIFNAYYNSIRYAVDDFLRELTQNRALDDQIIFYTSDHGQSLYQNNDPLTHCHSGEGRNAKLPIDEFKVPLMIFTKDAKLKLPNSQRKNMAQEQLFPTTLKLMGYSDAIHQAYGPSLYDDIEFGSRKSYVLTSGTVVNFDNQTEKKY
jgi:glucan phosphoethanolaminetransferase (alkaline phosphatase superfamily)